ncbi:MAG TPA: hypothetical protein VN694_01960 [Caulobacteraceae bacterium]|nr:hypothetical protein [Caulobacteraceae bacterium]
MRGQLTVALPAPVRGKATLALSDAASWDLLAHARPRQVVTIEVDDVNAPKVITRVDQVSAWVGWWPRVVIFAIAAIVLEGVAMAVTAGRPLQLVIGKDGRYSNSQVQLALWFGAVAWVYLCAVWLRAAWLGPDFIGGVGLTNNVIALTGLSALSFGGAKAITMGKVAAAAGDATTTSPPPSPAAAIKSGAEPNLRTDLFQNDQGAADLGDVQMIMITVAAVLIFLAASFHFLGKLALATPVTLPDVDTTLLASFGIGQGAYLFKKAALPLGQG